MPFAKPMAVLAGIAVILLFALSRGAPPVSAVTVFTVTNTAPTGAGSLHRAITDANATANSGGPDEIHFSIAPFGTQTIFQTTLLPTITEAVWIRGDTQPGCVLACIGLAGPAGGDGLSISGDDSVVENLSIYRFFNGVLITGDGNTVKDSHVGLDPSGTAPMGNTSVGVRIVEGDLNVISDNIISGNGNGILVEGATAGAVGNDLLSNKVGTDVTGMVDLGNGGNGVWLNNASGSEVSGSLISGNLRGVLVRDDSAAAAAYGNTFAFTRIGLDASGGPLGNDLEGIRIENASGTSIFASVDVRNSGLAGVVLTDVPFYGGPSPSASNWVIATTLDNGGLGIDIGDDGVTANDPLDGDTGPNSYQNKPVITSAVDDGVSTTISGTLNTTPLTDVQIYVFRSPSCDPSGYGEGIFTPISSPVFTTDGAGNVPWSLSDTSWSLGGLYVSVMTSNLDITNGPTSEHSQCMLVGDGDLDDDGCTDVQEDGPNHLLGGQRDKTNFWDFFDVTGDQLADLSDTLDVLGYFGNPGTSPAGNLRDRDNTASLPQKWRTYESNDGVDLTDALVSLDSFGDNCG